MLNPFKPILREPTRHIGSSVKYKPHPISKSKLYRVYWHRLIASSRLYFYQGRTRRQELKNRRKENYVIRVLVIEQDVVKSVTKLKRPSYRRENFSVWRRKLGKRKREREPISIFGVWHYHTIILIKYDRRF